MTLSAIRTAMAASGRRTVVLDPMVNPANFANVRLLIMNGNGSEGSQDMTDMSLDSRVTTWLSGAVMDTGIEKFVGAPTLLLPDGANDGLRYTAGFPALGTNDFTIEQWVLPHATQPNNPHRLAAKWATAGRRAWKNQRSTAGQITFSASGNGTATDLEMTTTLTAAASVWSWLVTQREGDKFTQWIQGVRDAAPVTNTLSIHGGSIEQLRFGLESSSASEFRGSMGPTRITIGEALFPGSPLTIPIPFEPYPVDLLELETTPNKLELEGSADNVLLEDSSGILVLEGTGDTLVLEDGSGSLALD